MVSAADGVETEQQARPFGGFDLALWHPACFQEEVLPLLQFLPVDFLAFHFEFSSLDSFPSPLPFLFPLAVGCPGNWQPT